MKDFALLDNGRRDVDRSSRAVVDLRCPVLRTTLEQTVEQVCRDDRGRHGRDEKADARQTLGIEALAEIDHTTTNG